MDITLVDPYDDDLLAAWHATYDVAQRHGRELSVAWQLEEIRAELQAPGSRRSLRYWAGLEAGDVVCTGALSLPLLDNLTAAVAEVNTHPDHRRQGHGSAMVDHLERCAQEAGRTRIDAQVNYPYDGPADGARHPDVEFATRRGYRLALGDVMRVLDLPVVDGVLDGILRDAAPHHASYRVESFVDAVPEAYVRSFAELNALLEVEAPTGELEREATAPDVDALREEERVCLAQGRTTYGTVALDGDGAVVALTALGTSRHDPGRVYQWGTLVSRDHRGHRLGAALKAVNLRLLQERDASATAVVTWNAEVNSHMVGINDLLGFRPVERLGELQKRLPTAS